MNTNRILGAVSVLALSAMVTFGWLSYPAHAATAAQAPPTVASVLAQRADERIVDETSVAVESNSAGASGYESTSDVLRDLRLGGETIEAISSQSDVLRDQHLGGPGLAPVAANENVLSPAELNYHRDTVEHMSGRPANTNSVEPGVVSAAISLHDERPGATGQFSGR